NAGYATGPGNQLTSDGTWTYSYDAEGNLTKKTKGASAETWTYGYDHLNHMVWAEKRATDGGTLQMRADYKYDGFGDRVEKDVDPDGAGALGTTVSRYAYDGWNPAKRSAVGTESNDVWADLNGSNTLQTRYVRGDVVDQLFASLSPGGVANWELTDRLGSVRQGTDGKGSVIDTIPYDGFGDVTEETKWCNGGRLKWRGGGWRGGGRL